MATKVVALVPAFNAEATVAETVGVLRTVPAVDQVIVIDDGSSDATAERAGAAGATVIRMPRNMGKGEALNAGLKQASGSVIVLVDDDMGKYAAEVEKLLDPILKDHADMTIAQFPKARKKGGFGIVKRTARGGIRLFTGREFHSPLSGQRALNPKAVEAIGRFESGWGVEVGLTIDACRKGLRVREVPVTMYNKETGRDWAGFVHRGKQLIGVIKALARRTLTR